MMAITLIRKIVSLGVEEIEYLNWVITAITLGRSIKEECHNGVTWHTDKLCVSLITIYPIIYGIREFLRVTVFSTCRIFMLP